uniref:Uncharacterized protein n=1 Tax=Vitrella brassicaformis TaxID=1169539 RepID=A0A7S1K552_9ALVE
MMGQTLPAGCQLCPCRQQPQQPRPPAADGAGKRVITPVTTVDRLCGEWSLECSSMEREEHGPHMFRESLSMYSRDNVYLEMDDHHKSNRQLKCSREEETLDYALLLEAAYTVQSTRIDPWTNTYILTTQYTYNKIQLTPHSTGRVEDLKKRGCPCGNKDWQKGKPTDITQCDKSSCPEFIPPICSADNTEKKCMSVYDVRLYTEDNKLRYDRLYTKRESDLVTQIREGDVMSTYDSSGECKSADEMRSQMEKYAERKLEGESGAYRSHRTWYLSSSLLWSLYVAMVIAMWMLNTQ